MSGASRWLDAAAVPGPDPRRTAARSASASSAEAPRAIETFRMSCPPDGGLDLRTRVIRATAENGSVRLQLLGDALDDGAHLERRAGHVLEQLVGRRALAEGPQLAQQPAGLAPGEPLVAEL